MRKACMEEGGGKAPCIQFPGQILALLSAAAVDDARTLLSLQHTAQTLDAVVGMKHLIGQVLSVETHAELVLLTKAEYALDILCHLGSGCGGKCEHRRSRHQLPELGYLQIGGAEIMPPLTDAMSLIHRDEADLHMLQFGRKEFGGKALGRHIEEAVKAEHTVVQHGEQFLMGESGMQSSSTYVPLAQVGHLVLHQCHQRRNHYAHAFHRQCRHLEGDTLAAASGHEPKGIAPGTYTFNNLTLDATELGVAPVLAEYFGIAVLTRHPT